MSVFTSSIFGENSLPVNEMRGGIQLKFKRDAQKTRLKLDTKYFQQDGLEKLTFSGIISEPGLIIIECLGEGDGITHQAHLLDYHFQESEKYILDFERVKIIGKNIVEFEVTLTVGRSKYKQELHMRFK